MNAMVICELCRLESYTVISCTVYLHNMATPGTDVAHPCKLQWYKIESKHPQYDPDIECFFCEIRLTLDDGYDIPIPIHTSVAIA